MDHTLRNTPRPTSQMGKSRPGEEKSKDSKSTKSQKLSWPFGLSRASFHQIPPAHGLPPGAANIPRKLVTGKDMSAVPVSMFKHPS